MKKKVLLFATYTLWDPPIQNSAIYFLRESWEVVIVQDSSEIPIFFKNKDFRILFINGFKNLKLPNFVKSILGFIYYWIKVKNILTIEKPDLIIAEMHRPLCAIPKALLKKTICFIPDIPDLKFSGKLDKQIIKYSWRQLNECFLIWSSDIYKAELTKKLSNLAYFPFVCYNCPSLRYFDDLNKSDSRKWLVNKLKENFLTINENSIIILRAGAVGEYGGIEETILALKALPKEIVFVLMGRPSENYKTYLNDLIEQNKLNHQVYLFDRPDDSIWKKILLGSDIGHLIQLKPKDNPSIAANYDLNSSLSNNRLFQYMAAGLPIISYNDLRMDIIYNYADCFCIVDITNFLNDFQIICDDLLNNNEKRNILGINAKKAFNQKYNWENQFSFIYKQII
jgi:glycosyltransferase involved in cell wall biosynthesis